MGNRRRAQNRRRTHLNLFVYTGILTTTVTNFKSAFISTYPLMGR